MKQEYKYLLLKDICSRLPYGVKVKIGNNTYTIKGVDKKVNDNGEWSYCVCCYGISSVEIDFCSPYLFPPSSMTEEQKEELKELCNMYDPYHDYDSYENWGIEVFNKHIHSDNYKFTFTADVIDWFCRHHFDYLGLIEKGLAIDATNMGVY